MSKNSYVSLLGSVAPQFDLGLLPITTAEHCGRITWSADSKFVNFDDEKNQLTD